MTREHSDCCQRGADGGVFGQESTSLPSEPDGARNEAPTRECLDCCETFALTSANFLPHRSCVAGLSPICRGCLCLRKRSGYDRSAPAMRARRCNQRPLRENERCPECFGMTHRIEGPKCWRCGELFAELPKLDLRDYLWRTPDREVV